MMLGLRFPRPRRSPYELIRSALVSCALVLFLHFALAMVPQLLPSFSLLALLPIAALIMVTTILLGRFFRRILGVSLSTPAFVLFNILLLWGIYITEIRHAVSSLMDAIMNAECALLLFGLYRYVASYIFLITDETSTERYFRIFSGNPEKVSYSSLPVKSDQNGFDALNFQYCHTAFAINSLSLSPTPQCTTVVKVSEEYSDSSFSQNNSSFAKVRHCDSCDTSAKEFDHQYTALTNCIDRKNQQLVIVLLAGFLIAESSYTICSTKFLTKSADTQRLERTHASNLVISTMLFCILQVLWQVVLLIWHIYCIWFNLKTEEWINWTRCAKVKLVVENQPGSPLLETRFTNPCNKGLLGNILRFLKS